MIGYTMTSFGDSLGKFKKGECSLLFQGSDVEQFTNKNALMRRC